jgi:hypothetical protein
MADVAHRHPRMNLLNVEATAMQLPLQGCFSERARDARCAMCSRRLANDRSSVPGGYGRVLARPRRGMLRRAC